MKQILLVITILFVSSICYGQSMSGYGGLTAKQKRQKITRNARMDAERSYYQLQIEKDRASANEIRRKDARANEIHNQAVLQSHRDAAKRNDK